MVTPPPLAPRRSSLRAAKAAERRARIVDAALMEFSEKGFTATRVEDIARRAGVAKGTIYLHFADKEALFAGIVQRAILPAMGALVSEGPADGESVRAFLLRLAPRIVTTLLEPPRSDVIRLLMAEGPRFPQIARTYYEQVVSRAMGRVAELGRRAAAEGDAGGALLATLPQLFAAPVILSVLWDGLFGRLHPLDAGALVRAQVELLLRGR